MEDWEYKKAAVATILNMLLAQALLRGWGMSRHTTETVKT